MRFQSSLRRVLAAGAVAAFCVAGMVSSASADLIYDNTAGGTNGGTFTTTGNTPRSFMADGVSTVALPQPWMDWEVQSMRWQIYVVGSGQAGVPVTYNNVTARVRIYDDFDPAGTPSVFASPVSDVTWNLGNITNNSATGGAQAISYTLPYANAGLPFILDDGQDIGASFQILVGGAANDNIATIIRGGGFDPVIGTSPNGWYRDANANGIIETSDFRTLSGVSHLAFSIDAIAIPEPAFAGLGAAGLLLLARRRRA